MIYHTRLIESFSNANARMIRMVHSMLVCIYAWIHFPRLLHAAHDKNYFPLISMSYIDVWVAFYYLDDHFLVIPNSQKYLKVKIYSLESSTLFLGLFINHAYSSHDSESGHILHFKVLFCASGACRVSTTEHCKTDQPCNIKLSLKTLFNCLGPIKTTHNGA